MTVKKARKKKIVVKELPKAKKPKVFKSDRAWQGQVILTGEKVEPKTQTTQPKSQRAQLEDGYMVMYRDNVEIARFPVDKPKK